MTPEATERLWRVVLFVRVSGVIIAGVAVVTIVALSVARQFWEGLIIAAVGAAGFALMVGQLVRFTRAPRWRNREPSDPS